MFSGAVSEKKRYDPVTSRMPKVPRSLVRSVPNELLVLHNGRDMDACSRDASTAKVTSVDFCANLVEGMSTLASRRGPERTRNTTHEKRHRVSIDREVGGARRGANRYRPETRASR